MSSVRKDHIKLAQVIILYHFLHWSIANTWITSVGAIQIMKWKVAQKISSSNLLLHHGLSQVLFW